MFSILNMVSKFYDGFRLSVLSCCLVGVGKPKPCTKDVSNSPLIVDVFSSLVYSFSSLVIYLDHHVSNKRKKSMIRTLFPFYRGYPISTTNPQTRYIYPFPSNNPTIRSSVSSVSTDSSSKGIEKANVRDINPPMFSKGSASDSQVGLLYGFANKNPNPNPNPFPYPNSHPNPFPNPKKGKDVPAVQPTPGVLPGSSSNRPLESKRSAIERSPTIWESEREKRTVPQSPKVFTDSSRKGKHSKYAKPSSSSSKTPYDPGTATSKKVSKAKDLESDLVQPSTRNDTTRNHQKSSNNVKIPRTMKSVEYTLVVSAADKRRAKKSQKLNTPTSTSATPSPTKSTHANKATGDMMLYTQRKDSIDKLDAALAKIRRDGM
jgi:hypothetical protein